MKASCFYIYLTLEKSIALGELCLHYFFYSWHTVLITHFKRTKQSGNSTIEALLVFLELFAMY